MSAERVTQLVESALWLRMSGDQAGARRLLEQALQLDPSSARARELLKALEAPAILTPLPMEAPSERTLEQAYEQKLGGLGRRPRVLLRGKALLGLRLDHRAGFLLAQIDGTVTYEDLLSLSGMSRLDTLQILAQLQDQKVIASGS